MIRKFLITITEVHEEDAPLSVRRQTDKKVISSFIRTRYTTILRRIKKHTSYSHMGICSREEFFNWSIKNKTLAQLYKEWQESKFQNRLIPTVNRINPKGGYTLGNIEWVAFHENARKVTKK